MEADAAFAAMAAYDELRDTHRFVAQAEALVRAECACAGAAAIASDLAALVVLDAEAAVSVANPWKECLALTRSELERLPRRANCSETRRVP